jgi:membrane protein implicated in regulation of membrane protease activity
MSARELTVQLGEQLGRLVKDEVALARAELFASARQSVLGGGLLSAAAMTGLGSWLAMVAAAIAAIAEGLPVWAAALIVAGVLGITAGALALLGARRLRRGTPPLKMTMDSLREELNDLSARVRTRR